VNSWGTRWAYLALVLVALLACDKRATTRSRVIAKAGIFYGGQIQNRTDWPLVLDATRQNQGFRLEFAAPLSKPASVAWDVVRPASRKKGHSDNRDGTAAPLFSAVVPAGSERFDQIIAFTESDRPGGWKLRVTVDGTTVLERAINIVAKPPATPDD